MSIEVIIAVTHIISAYKYTPRMVMLFQHQANCENATLSKNIVCSVTRVNIIIIQLCENKSNV